jgi:hypothetical protein
MHALFDAGDSLCAAYRFDHAIARDWRPVRQTQDTLASQMPNGLQRGRQALRHR